MPNTKQKHHNDDNDDDDDYVASKQKEKQIFPPSHFTIFASVSLYMSAKRLR